MINDKLSVIIFLICSLYTVNKINAQEIGKEKLFTGDNIDWSDFKGEVDNNESDKYGAKSIFSLKYDYSIIRIKNTDSVKIKISVQVFISDSSWVKPDQKNDEVLNHEKGHLRLGLIEARACENKINNQVFTEKNYKSKIDSLFRESDMKCNTVQDKYDDETNHSINKEEQKRWNSLIERLLVKNK